MSIFTADNLIRLVVCAVGVALLVRALSWIWKRVLNLDVPRRHQNLLASAVVAFLAGFDFIRDYGLATTMSVIIVGGWFLTKWLMRAVDKLLPHS